MNNLKIKQLLLSICFITLASSFRMITGTGKAANKETDHYPFKASYSSDVVASSNTGNIQKVLTVWKMFETKQIDALKEYYADTVIYEDASGYRYSGPVKGLLDFARGDVEDLDSLRFDISQWESVHLNDRNEDWVYIWATERQYPKSGKPDSALIHEQWKIVNGKVAYFNRYHSRLPRNK